MDNRTVSAGQVERGSFRPDRLTVPLPEGKRIELQLNEDTSLWKKFACSLKRDNALIAAQEAGMAPFGELGRSSEQLPPQHPHEECTSNPYIPTYINIYLHTYIHIYIYALRLDFTASLSQESVKGYFRNNLDTFHDNKKFHLSPEPNPLQTLLITSEYSKPFQYLKYIPATVSYP